MTADGEQAPSVLVWFEDSPEGRCALTEASVLARRRSVCLTVVAVAALERVIGCGRCLQGTVLWNIELQKIAREELLEARSALDDPADASYEVLVGDPAEMITQAAERLGADVIVLPALKTRRFGPPNRRNVSGRVAARGPWHVIVASRQLALSDPLPACTD
ncbi:MAG TPA: universal stress protein [Solirubrobacteraceae bacterium]|jgi:nucleotide-binding universal stress UspA family protein|nr:universal stress protein [Solirubrobacteraceae bacterium]